MPDQFYGEDWQRGFDDGYEYVVDVLKDQISKSSPTTSRGKAQIAFFKRVMWALEHPE